MRFLLLFVTLLLSLTARDNPFEDVITKEVFPISTNIPKTLTHLKRESLRLPDSARVIKRIMIEYQNLDGSIDTLSSTLDKKVDWHMPIVVTHQKAPSKANSYTEKLKLPSIKFATKANKMKLITKDKLLRHFMLVRPHRIVLDFKGSSQYLSKKYSKFSKPFKKVRLGNHDGYYRVVVELDGQYEYQEKSDKRGITLTIR